MKELNPEVIATYLQSVLGHDIAVRHLSLLGASTEDTKQKRAGYGVPVLIEYEMPAGGVKRAVIHTMSPSPFGHEHMSDRARILLWQRDTFNRLPRHIRSMDAGTLQHDGTPVSLGDPDEFFLLTEYAEGDGYFLDLERIAKTGELTEIDLARVDTLCDYLANIHSVSCVNADCSNADLYRRRIRELIGDGECIMGIADSYASASCHEAAELRQIELLCVDWRWRLKCRTHRLRQVHGDFHPWNILFGSTTDFAVLDRSRGEFGDAADDVTCLTMNYIFFSLERSGRLEGAFQSLFRRFWNRYLECTRDREMLEVAAPFFVFRALVMASPLWYPDLPDAIRKQLFTFCRSALREEIFDPEQVNRYCGLKD